MTFKIEAIAVNNALKNYIWMLVDGQHGHAVAIDPTQADLVLDYCRQHQLKLTQIWITHKHQDHIGGLAELREQTTAQIYAPKLEQDNIIYVDHLLQDNQVFRFAQLDIQVIATPGHTLGHICYYIDPLDSLFCGDTLFALGCGRVFEGTHQQMFQSLQRLAALPPQTRVYCTHEYTLDNARFAVTVEPDNQVLQQRYQDLILLYEQHGITLPSSIAEELQTNPFLRCQNEQQFAHIRTLKDQF